MVVPLEFDTPFGAPGIDQLVERHLARASPIGRIEQDQVKRSLGWPQRQDRRCPHVASRAGLQIGDIGSQRADRGGILLDEDATGRAARQRFKAERARSGEQIGHRQP